MPRAGGGFSFKSGARIACLGIIVHWVSAPGHRRAPRSARRRWTRPRCAIAVPVIAVDCCHRPLDRQTRQGAAESGGRAVTISWSASGPTLATPKRDQLKFEEGEDIFSRTALGHVSAWPTAGSASCANWWQLAGSRRTRTGTSVVVLQLWLRSGQPSAKPLPTRSTRHRAPQAAGWRR